MLGIGLADLGPADLDVRPTEATASAQEIDSLVAERDAARSAKDFARSDRLRDKLADLGVTVEDQPGEPPPGAGPSAGPESWEARAAGD